jgi:hypothetical protein
VLLAKLPAPISLGSENKLGERAYSKFPLVFVAERGRLRGRRPGRQGFEESWLGWGLVLDDNYRVESQGQAGQAERIAPPRAQLYLSNSHASSNGSHSCYSCGHI